MFFTLLDLAGIVAFAVSGALKAIDKKMDVFGITIIAIVTALGGGTLRDILIGKFPVTWLTDLTNLYIVIGSTIITIFCRNCVKKLPLSLLFFDAIGIGVFTLTGMQLSLSLHLDPLVCVLLGTVTACFGGVIRDILCNETPAIFQKEIYATACMIGGGVFFVCQSLAVPVEVNYIATIVVIITIRLLAVYYKLSLPQIGARE